MNEMEKNEHRRGCTCRCQEHESHRQRRPWRNWLLPILTHSAVFLLTVLSLFLYQRLTLSDAPLIYSPSSTTDREERVYTPLRSYVNYTIDTPAQDAWSNELFSGEPSRASERAWNELFYPGPIRHGVRLRPDEARLTNISEGIRLKDGDYASVLGIVYNLHCLRRFRQDYWADHYYPNISDQERARNRHHALHCIEILRTSMMCNADLTLYPYYYSGMSWHPTSVGAHVRRQCVNWNSLTAFRLSRQYRSEDIDLPEQALHEYLALNADPPDD